jgi:hypothetical protein
MLEWRVAYMVFCILCILAAVFSGLGTLVFWAWAIVTVLWIGAALMGGLASLIGRLLH